MVGQRIIGIDETRSLSGGEPCLIAASVSYNPRDLYRCNLGEKKRGYDPRSGRHYSELDPEGEFAFTVLYPEMLDTARRVYVPATRIEDSLNGKFPEFMLRMTASEKLLAWLDFDPHRDTAIIDAYFRPTAQTQIMLDLISRRAGCEVPKHAVICTTHADGIYRPVRSADDTAYRLFDKFDKFADRRMPFVEDDILDSGSSIHHGIRHNIEPSYVNRHHASH